MSAILQYGLGILRSRNFVGCKSMWNKDQLNNKRTPLRLKITATAVAFMMLVTVISSTMFAIMALDGTDKITETSFERTVDNAVRLVESELEELSLSIQDLAASADIYRKTRGDEEFKEYLSNMAEELGFKTMYYTDKAGISLEGVDFSEYDFYQVAVSGETYLGEPMITKSGDGTDIMGAAPVWKDGIHGSETVGTIIVVIDGKRLSDIVSEISIGETGDVYILNSEGQTIADHFYELVISGENTQIDCADDPSYKDFIALEKRALNGENAIGIVEFDGDKVFLCVHYLEDRDWVVGAYATTWEYQKDMIIQICVCCILSILMCTLGFFIISSVVKRVVNPIVETANVISEVAKGNYNIEINYHSNDEVGDMILAVKDMMDNTSSCVNDIARVMDSMSEGDFTVTTEANYIGVFSGIKEAAHKVLTNINMLLASVDSTSKNISNSSNKVAAGSHALSQGTTEQASALEQLAATLDDIAKTVRHTSDNSVEATKVVSEANEEVEISNQRMHELTAAMNNIEESSKNIGKIIKSIEDIAFQTNILALNAAVEAARAGAAGKGFAVVADEVRSLAAKSAEAAKNTNVLITESLKAVEAGTANTRLTADALESVADKMSKAAKIVSYIKDAAVAQSDSIDQITVGVDQISAVVQANASTADASADASSEMDEQGNVLAKIVSTFKIKDPAAYTKYKDTMDTKVDMSVNIGGMGSKAGLGKSTQHSTVTFNNTRSDKY